MTTLDLDHAAPAPPKRDRWGRYLITPADGGKPIAHTRATTWAGAIDDKEGLIGWSARVAMLGVARRPDLYAIACAAKTDADLKEYVDAAKAAGGAEHGRNVGTALHAFTEQVDRGEEPTVPAEWRADLDAYRQAIADAGLTPVPHLIERVCVVPELQVAGTFDRCYSTADGELVIGDVKTGQSLDWSALSISIQLALYAHAETIYDTATDTHQPMPPVRRDVGYVVHVPSGRGRAEVLEVDLTAGWEAARVCGQVRQLRSTGKRKGVLMRPVAAAEVEPTAEPSATERPRGDASDPHRYNEVPGGDCCRCGEPRSADVHVDAFDGLPSTEGRDPLTKAVDDARTRPRSRRAWVVERVEQVKAHGFAAELIALWPKGVPGTATDHVHDDSELDLIVAALDIVDSRHGLPLAPDPARVAATAARIAEHQAAQRARIAAAAPPPRADEGDGLTGDEIEELRELINSAPAAERDLLTGWLREANTAKVGFSVSAQGTVRRRGIIRAGLALAALCDGDADNEDLVDAAARLAGLEVDDTVGAFLGQLTTSQADQLADAARRAPGLALTYIDGLPHLADKQIAS